jgi:predicted Zn-dependent protease
VLHELAHIFGVGHSTDPNSFMYPSLETVAWITPADRAALALAGSRPC